MGNGGPCTAAGKALVARNAISFGIQAATPVIPGVESEQDWLALRAGILAALAPLGDLESALAFRVAELLWRLRRVVRFECHALARGIEDIPALLAIYKNDPSYQTPEAHERLRGLRTLPMASDVDRVVRYEAHLGRQLTSSLHELEALQARRRGQPAPLLRVDLAAEE